MPTTKSTTRRAPKPRSSIKLDSAEDLLPTSFADSDSSEGRKVSKKLIVIPLLVIIVVALLYYFRSQFIVATVNGKPIWRTTLVGELEKQSGKQALDGLITKTLILQEARKENVNVSDDEINQEIKKIEDGVTGQGQKLDDLLKQQGMTRDNLKEQIKIQKMVEKMAGKDITVSDKEISDYIEQNKSFIPKEAKPEDINAQIKQQLEQQKINEKIQTWIKNLRDKAKINYLI